MTKTILKGVLALAVMLSSAKLTSAETEAGTLNGDVLVNKLGLSAPAVPILNADVVATTHYEVVPEWIRERAKNEGVTLHERVRHKFVVSGSDYQIEESHSIADGFRPWLKTRFLGGDLIEGNLSDASAIVTKFGGQKFSETPLYGASQYFWKALFPLIAADAITKLNLKDQGGTIDFVEGGAEISMTFSGLGEKGVPFHVKTMTTQLKQGGQLKLDFDQGSDAVNLNGWIVVPPAAVKESVLDKDGKLVSQQSIQFFVNFINSAEHKNASYTAVTGPMFDGKFSVVDRRIPGKEARYLSRDTIPPIFVVEQLLASKRFSAAWSEAIASSPEK